MYSNSKPVPLIACLASGESMALANKAEQTKWRKDLTFSSTYSHWMTRYLTSWPNTSSPGQFESWWSWGTRDDSEEEIRPISFKRYNLQDQTYLWDAFYCV